MTLSHITTDHIEMLLNNDCLDEAEEIIIPLVERHPDNYSAWHKLAALQMKRGNWDYAAQSLTKAQEIFPTCEAVWFALAVCLNNMGYIDRAILAIRQLLVINPRHTAGMMAGGEMSWRTYKYWDAYQFYEKYLNILPYKRKEMLPNLLMCLQYAEGERADDISVKIALADRLQEIGAVIHAREVTIRAKNVFPAGYCRSHPGDAMALMNVIATNMTVCNWEEWEDHCVRLINLVMQEGQFCEPSSFNLIGTTQQEQFVNAVRFTDWKYPERIRFRPARLKTGRTRIGYISADFHEHATGYLIPDLFLYHNRQKFEVFAYSTGTEDHSPARGRIRQNVDTFTDLKGKTHEEAADIIRHDEIDILVDLKGYTTGNCADILVLRPAPVIVGYLGYPGTTGGICDYIIADKMVITEENRPYFSEKVVYVEGGYQVNSLENEDLPVVKREQYGLPFDATVYACFNQPYKITPAIFSVWMRLLKDDKHAVLWILEMQPEQLCNLRYEAEKSGISIDRIIPMKFCNRAEHLARMKLVDYYLETAPVGGHTTLSDWLKSGGTAEKSIVPRAHERTFVTGVSESIYRNRDTLFDSELTTRRIEDALEAIIKDVNG